ncbi:nucleoside deaminase [Pseudokineococcus lusitanus]|uniref:Guanine deaminase n=1 Tax=Pseudokineococcus lusitanus TaxID=763993 RepID=A0A3N1HR26_9ACTN|nr:nucleoside deaminase [Pseudokineococcus lusitanus]ROP44968.1 guanine deaminase [Pseudokineococcus lusitanus]
MTTSPDAGSDATHLARSVALALDNVEDGGKPFACVVVERSTGEVLQESTNQVVQSGDVTAHAEITALRALAAAGRRELTGCDVFVTASPCPMCLGALYYAAPERVVFAATREQEGEHYEDGGRYFSLATFYDEYARPEAERALPMSQGEVDDPQAPFRRYRETHADD